MIPKKIVYDYVLKGVSNREIVEQIDSLNEEIAQQTVKVESQENSMEMFSGSTLKLQESTLQNLRTKLSGLEHVRDQLEFIKLSLMRLEEIRTLLTKADDPDATQEAQIADYNETLGHCKRMLDGVDLLRDLTTGKVDNQVVAHIETKAEEIEKYVYQEAKTKGLIVHPL